MAQDNGNDGNGVFSALGKLAQAGISSLSQAGAFANNRAKKKRGGACTPCAIKAQVVDQRNRVAKGQL